MSRSAEIQEFKDILAASQRAVIFTGAGISTESGIPDFRGPNGIWNKIKPIEFDDFMRSEKMRQKSWQRWFDQGGGFTEAQPNAGHVAVANLVASGKASSVITQNVDNLHQQSGIPESQVIELHGNATYAKCLSCNEIITLKAIEAEYKSAGKVGPCDKCGGIIKTATVSFGQMMPEEPMRRAEEETLACDLFIVLGSSLTVYPAAGFPSFARQSGANLIIVNQQPTDHDGIANLVIREGIGETMQAVLEG